jgi:methionyl-tRNA formyltransferase
LNLCEILRYVRILSMPARIVFMGSPEFSLPTLRGLAENYSLVGVITQPDRPAGRGRILTPPPVKELAMALGLPVIQPNRLREPEALAQLQAWQPDLIVVAAFGQILRQNVLDLPPRGCINVHASFLPRWRGAAPIQAAIAAGDASTGITVMKMDAGVDTGAILSQAAVQITDQDTGGTLTTRLAIKGAELLLETLPDYLDGKIQPQPQDNALATYAPMLKKEDELLDFTLPADVLARRVRAYQPRPGTYIMWEGNILKILRAYPCEGSGLTPGRAGPTPGQRGLVDKRPALGTLQGWLVLDEVQPAGKKPMPGQVFLNGAHNWVSTNA